MCWNDLVDKNHNANSNFANRIIAYFNRDVQRVGAGTRINEKTLRMGFRSGLWDIRGCGYRAFRW